VVGFLFIAVYGLFVWFAWRGRNWARVVLWVFAGLGIVSGLAGLGLGSPLPFLTALGGFQLLLLIAAVVLLALKPSNEWYRFRKWQRATGQG
jgi:heme A synthase